MDKLYEEISKPPAEQDLSRILSLETKLDNHDWTKHSFRLQEQFEALSVKIYKQYKQ